MMSVQKEASGFPSLTSKVPLVTAGFTCPPVSGPMIKIIANNTSGIAAVFVYIVTAYTSIAVAYIS